MKEYTNKLSGYPDMDGEFIFNNCGICQCSAGQTYGPKRREYHFIYFVSKGKGILHIQRQIYSIHQNQLFIIPAGEVAKFQADTTVPWKYSWVGFQGGHANLLIRSLVQYVQRNQQRFVLDCRDASFYERQITSILQFLGNEITAFFHCNSIFFNLISLLLDELGIDSASLSILSVPYQAQRYMDLHFHDNIQVTDVAAAVGVHANYLASIFHKYFQITPKKYLSQLRLRKAKELLTQTDDPIYIIANSVGFPDSLAFSKFFKKLEGKSPSAYRAQEKTVIEKKI